MSSGSKTGMAAAPLRNVGFLKSTSTLRIDDSENYKRSDPGPDRFFLKPVIEWVIESESSKGSLWRCSVGSYRSRVHARRSSDRCRR